MRVRWKEGGGVEGRELEAGTEIEKGGWENGSGEGERREGEAEIDRQLGARKRERWREREWREK